MSRRKKSQVPRYALLPDIELQSDVNRATEYANQHAESLRRRLAEFELDARRHARYAACACKTCFYLRGGGAAGQAFTTRPCEICATVVTYSSTHTLKYCEPCAEKYTLCRECGGSRDPDLRFELAPPRKKAEIGPWWEGQIAATKVRKAAVQAATREDCARRRGYASAAEMDKADEGQGQ